MNLLSYIEEETFDKNNENLKYLNDISGNLLQVFEGKDITFNLETNVKFFMSETVCQFFLQKMRTNEMLCGKKLNIFLSKHTSVWTVEIFLSEIMSVRLGVTCVSALYYIWLNWSQHLRRFNKIWLLKCFLLIFFIQFIVMCSRWSIVTEIRNYCTIAFLTHSHKLHPPNRLCQ